MKAVTLYPADLNCYDEYDSKWIALIKKFGWDDSNSPWVFVIVAHIDLD